MFVGNILFKSGSEQALSSPDEADIIAISEALERYYREGGSPIHDFCGVIKINVADISFVAMQEVDMEDKPDA